MSTSNKASAKILLILKAVSLGSLLLIASCSNPRDASKDNFKKIIGEYIKNDKACTVGYSQFPVTVPDSNDKYKKFTENKIGVFIKQGWIKVEKSNVSRGGFMPAEMSTIYSLTPEGYKNSRVAGVSKGLMEGNTTYYKFCYAQGKELINVDAFGDPVEEGGQKIVKVPFTYKVTGKKDDWVDKYPDKNEFMEVNSDNVTLRLTNEGWKVLGRTQDLKIFSDLSK